MLTAEQIAALRDKATDLTLPIINYLLQDLAERIAQAGQFTATAQYETWKLQQLGLSQKEIKQKLKKLLKATNSQIEQLMTQSAEAGYNFDLKQLPSAGAVAFEENAAVQQIVSAAVTLAQDDLSNITQTLGMTDPYGNAQPLQTAYRQCMDFAFTQVSTGATDYNTAVREATRNLVNKGVCIIDYESGVHTSLEAAVRRNVMGGLGLMQEQISKQNHDDMGANGWEIDAHSNSAPDHEPIQGKQYSDADYEALNNSLVRRIGTLNCGHAAFPIILGVSLPQYSTSELEAMRDDNEKGIEYNGKHYTGYEATQRQRQLEAAIRKQKRRILVDEATGDTKKLETDRIKLQTLRQEYNRFSKAAGLRTQTERAEVAGFGYKEANAADKTYKDYQKSLEKSAESDIVKSITVDNLKAAVSDSPIKEEVAARIAEVLEDYNASSLFDHATAKRLGAEIVFQTDAQKAGTYFDTVLVLNEDILGGKTVTEIDDMFRQAKNTLADSMREAIIHEMYHSKLIHNMSYAQLESLYDEMADIHIEGLGKTAKIDGSECIAELGILLERGDVDKAPADAIKLFERFFGEL